MTDNKPTTEIKLLGEPAGIRVIVPYKKAFQLEVFDRMSGYIPQSDRSFNKPDNTWLVEYKWGKRLAQSIEKHFGVVVDAPMPPQTLNNSKIYRTRYKIEYIGQPKWKGDNNYSSCFVNDSWNFIIPEQVIVDFLLTKGMNVKRKSDENKTLYDILSGPQLVVNMSSSQEDIKRAFRFMARQWHPDVCKEPDATERFKEINGAYQKLSDPKEKSKYDAANRIAQTITDRQFKPKVTHMQQGVQLPSRCGWLTVDAERSARGITVTRIYGWEEIIENGKALVTSWMPDPEGKTIGSIRRDWVPVE